MQSRTKDGFEVEHSSLSERLTVVLGVAFPFPATDLTHPKVGLIPRSDAQNLTNGTWDAMILQTFAD